MTVANRHLPGAPRVADWREQSSCREVDPELWFPKGIQGIWQIKIGEAKKICGGCPVRDDCLESALDRNITEGIWGGLTEEERASLRRARQRRALAAAAAGPEEVRPPGPKRTLRNVFEENTRAVPGGHLAWTGGNVAHFEGRVYTPKRIAFLIDRGCPPEGLIRAGCGWSGCVLPAHIADTAERAGAAGRSGAAA